MYEHIETKDVKARKSYKCDWCGEEIKKGELHEYQTFVYDDELCHWRAHLACSRIASAIWDYADPYDGMGSDTFDANCAEVCREFICPDCPEWDKEYSECNKDDSYCLDRMDEFFKTHVMYATREGYYRIWRCKEKDEKI